MCIFNIYNETICFKLCYGFENISVMGLDGHLVICVTFLKGRIRIFYVE